MVFGNGVKNIQAGAYNGARTVDLNFTIEFTLLCTKLSMCYPQMNNAEIEEQLHHFMYRTRAIISCGLYIFYPISKDHFFVFKEFFSENSVLMYGLYSRAASNQERLMMAPVSYL